MSEAEPNLLDLLDEMRELPAAEQQRRLQELPAAAQEQLCKWLHSAQASADPFDAKENAFAGADPALLSHLRGHLTKLSPGDGSAARRDVGQETTSSPTMAPTSDPAPRSPGGMQLALQTGDVVRKQFRIVCKLGRGGMGEVFRAIDEHAGEHVALKFIPADRMANPEALALLKSEVRVAHRIRNPYVCAVHGLHLDNDPSPGRKPLPPFIAMQFIEGEDLHVLLSRVERLSGPKVVRIAHELAKGMAAIHAAGILHRDLKPSNVMLDVHGTVQILDFGIAAHANPGEGENAWPIAGTPAYMAPEARTQPATPATDIYAIGLVLFELATGQMASKLLQETPDVRQMLERFKDQIPRELFEPISRCLPRNPAERFQAVEDLIGALPAPPATKSERRESITMIARSDAVAPLKPWAIALTVAMIAIMAVGVFLTPVPARSVVSTHLTMDRGELAGSAHNLTSLFDAKNDRYNVNGFAAALSGSRAGSRAGANQSGEVYFWYRSADFPLEPVSATRGVSVSDPPPAAGITTVCVDTHGQLLEAYRLPQGPSDYAWNGNDAFPQPLAAELDKMRETIGPIHFPFTFVRSSGGPAGWSSPVPFPSNTDYWIESAGDETPVGLSPLLIGALGTRVLYIGRFAPSATASPPDLPKTAPVPAALRWFDQCMQPSMQWLKKNANQEVAFWWMYVLPLLGLLLAARNVRLRRCDTRHALRMAVVVFVLSFLGWVLTTHPGATGKLVLDRWNTGIGVALLYAVEAWIGYAAVDPYARLTWKRCLIGYARFTDGWPRAIRRDKVVGRSLLLGALFGLLLALLLKLQNLWTATSALSTTREQMSAMLIGDGAGTAGVLCRSAATAIVFSLLQFVTLVLLHWLTRLRSLAIVLFCLITPLIWALFRNEFVYPAYLIYPVIGVLVAITLIHEGVLACAVGMFFATVIGTVPITFNSAATNFNPSLCVLLFLASIVGAGLVGVLPNASQMNWLPVDPLRVATTELASGESSQSKS